MLKNLGVHWKPACAEGGTVRLYQFDPEEKAWIDPVNRVVQHEVQAMGIATLPDKFFLNKWMGEPLSFFLLLASKWGDECEKSIRQGRIIVILDDGKGNKTLCACTVLGDKFIVETVITSPYRLCRDDIVVVTL